MLRSFLFKWIITFPDNAEDQNFQKLYFKWYSVNQVNYDSEKKFLSSAGKSN